MAIIIHRIFTIVFISCFIGFSHPAYGAVSEKAHQTTILLERVYLDGVVGEEEIEQKNMTKEAAISEYNEWRLVAEFDDELIFRTHVDDISPLLKANGYFGVSGEGILSVYEGVPTSQQQKVIQSFFQLDINKLESRQHEQLQHGIRIHSKDQYLALLNFYKPYSH
ncbi:BofC C-terminal domain-containing protein [Priestia koreensis]|uniref:BofC C-terminal domain-containing protein n=1 Tax=Priestia koreensis TaxID=284581 RepID=UPI00203EE7DA|nr:intercompartmental signaling factor BofC [Priestia koreensis]